MWLLKRPLVANNLSFYDKRKYTQVVDGQYFQSDAFILTLIREAKIKMLLYPLSTTAYIPVLPLRGG